MVGGGWWWLRPILGFSLSLDQAEQKQAGAELGQAQLKLGLDFILIFCEFGFTRLSLVQLDLHSFGSVYLAPYISKKFARWI